MESNFRYLDKTLTFEDTKIWYTNDGGNVVNVMMDWEEPMMSASAAYVCEGGGDILEIGFGMGIAANYIQSHSIDSHTICEIHPHMMAFFGMQDLQVTLNTSVLRYHHLLNQVDALLGIMVNMKPIIV